MKPIILIMLFVGAMFFILRPKPATSPQSTPALQTPAPKKTAETSVSNPDGTKKLILRKEKPSGTITTYTFIVAQDNSEREIFTQSADPNTKYDIPANTWSPGENTYLFLRETTTGTTRYLVFKATGQPFTDEEQFLEVTSLFAKTANKYRIRDITGWDSPELLHVQTETEQGAKGPSFWFEVPSRVFLQLAS
ncbi:hypothetical protein A3A64_02505 [Candidatus Gottesmanbacteria bacterium RIFCSPLOWO2_01_FULL_48_11]|uniref:Uncharacterized protein n=1 Tax=Candidatus Gottesmanbacteria bacterium RIFCSPLOWO2_01_FULL_48_11 TaxID=1798395 RepID=A0A1F6AT82_9BACT|nr:MAG: hypothetical protein A3A64_02505 [Candidatus Gottesmanbacteria bacterium RIFCSPLOWO2_01_FULL_48_11]